MGEDEPSSGGLVLLPNGLLPDEAASVMRVLDSERWSKAEERTADLIACIQPNLPSEKRRNAVADYVQRLVTKCFPCQVFTFGSVPLKTYLPDGDIDLTAFCKNTSLKESWAHQVRDILESEEKNEEAEFRVKEVQYIQAEVKLIKCLVENIVVDISFNQLGGLCTLCFLEEVDHEINQNHLFKRSIILIKAWCYYESRVLGAHHGLISTYALETLVLYIFHVFNNSFAGPLEVLYRFLEFFSKFDWENFCVSLWGPVPISSLPDVTAEPPRKDGGDLQLSRLFDACSSVYAVSPGGQENQGQPFVTKHFNVIDPLRINNNLGRSVSKGNFFRIRSAFAFGAKRLARLLDCPKEELYFEVNQFFMNTWDRHGNGQRPDAPGNDLWNLRLSNHDQLSDPESIIKNTSSDRNRIIHETQDITQGSSNHLSQLGSSEFKLKASDASTIARIKTQKNGENAINSKSSNLIKKETTNVGVGMDKVQRSLKSDNLANEIHGRFLFARTRSSPELSDAYDEVASRVKHGGNPESGKNQATSTRLDNTKSKNQESDTVAGHGTRSAGDPSSVSHNVATRVSSRQNIEDAADSRIVSNNYQDDAGLRAMNNDFATVSGAQGMHQEEQDLVNILASSAAHGFNGSVHVPLNLASQHLPLPIPSSILASMGYAQRSMGGMVPTNFPMIENPWGTNLPFPQGVVPSNLTHYFPGMGLTPPGPEEHVESGNESFASGEVNSRDADNGFWHEQDRRPGGHDLENGGFKMLQSDDKQQSTSSRYSPSSRVGNTGSSVHSQHKFPKETSRGSTREDHADAFHYLDNRGNESFFDDRTASSRSVSASHAGSMRSKTSSESSWEGSSAKVSKSSREKRGRRTSPFSGASTSHGKDKSVSEHSSTQADDDSRDWNVLSTIGTEAAERSSERHPSTSWQVVRHQLPGFEQAHTSESDSVIPFSPIVLNSHSQQRNADSSGVPPFTFYATGPPVPFVTMLPLYNFPTEPGTSDASTSQFSREETVDNSNSGQNFDSPERPDQHASNTSNSVKMDSFIELPKHKPDILNSDFTSHWQNLQFGRFCQDTRHPTPMPYSQTPVPVPPGYIQGRLPLDSPGRSIPPNMNIFPQFMSYGPHIVPVAAPLPTLPNRTTAAYQRHVEDLPRIRSGTGTYLPNPKVSIRDRHSSGTRRGNYTFDRNDHHGDREGNWNGNSKSRSSGRGYSRSHSEKSNARVDRLAGSESRSDRPWSSHRHDTSLPGYQSQNGPVRANSNANANANSPYGMYPLPSMNHGGVSSNGPNIPSVVMIYPYNNNASYGTHPDQLEFGSLGPMGFSSPNEITQLNEASGMSGAVSEEQRFHGSSAQQSPDQPSSPHCIQR